MNNIKTPKTIAIKENKQLPSLMDEASILISQAIDKNVPVETMEKLLAMRRELKAEKAKEEFDRSMALFQRNCPTIQKTKAVKTGNGVIAYKYAPIESIVEQVRDELSFNGFSYSTNMNLKPDGVKVMVKVTHKAGHSEVTEMEVPFGNKTQVMSQTQVVAAAQTFAKRYAFCNAFGILTGDEDTDATPTQQIEKPKVEKMSLEQNKFIHKLLTQKGKTDEELHEVIEKLFNKSSLTELTKVEATEVIERLMKLDDIPDESMQVVDGENIAEDAVSAGL